MIRQALAAEAPRLRTIEAAAGEMFRDVDMAAVAEGELPTVPALRGFIAEGRVWVLTPQGESPMAYLLTDVVDGCVHIEQVSVHPSRARQGLGRALIDHIGATAYLQGIPAITLTTFTEVPWNAPYYRRLGFIELHPADITPGLHAVRAHERELGLDAWPRICMRRETTSWHGV